MEQAKKFDINFLIGMSGSIAATVFLQRALDGSEPWDAAPIPFLFMLALGGFVMTFILKTSVSKAYCSIYAGWFLYGFAMFVTGNANAFPIGAVVMLFYYLAVLPGAYLGQYALKQLPLP